MGNTREAAATCFDAACRDCTRLAGFLDELRAAHPDYHCRPVPPFGPADSRLLVVGLAPGMHGANATGRPFTGDHAGILLYRTLHRFGFATRPESTSADDGLELVNCRITNAVKCLPPGNRPTGGEVRQCNHYLSSEIDQVRPRVIVALGRVAHEATLRALGERLRDHPFGHAHRHRLNKDVVLLDSYHCSRYNTQTGRLTEAMFIDVFRMAAELIL